LHTLPLTRLASLAGQSVEDGIQHFFAAAP
jgi:hypothetical protein